MKLSNKLIESLNQPTRKHQRCWLLGKDFSWSNKKLAILMEILSQKL